MDNIEAPWIDNEDYGQEHYNLYDNHDEERDRLRDLEDYNG